jgi:imidazolonepropionase-like amidohydrolase
MTGTTSGPALHLRARVLPGDEVRDVFVVDGRISFVEQGDAVTVLDSGWLVPGLVDAHAHLSLFSPAGDNAPDAERIAASGRAQLDVGVLALREPGSPLGAAARGLGPLDGMPRVVVAGHLLARTGRYFPGLGREIEPEDLAEAAAEEAAASGTWVKVIADFIAPGGSITPAFPADALGEAARAAHAAGARIAAHATCRESIDACVAAGFDSLEHATFLAPDQLEAVAAAGTVLVPTMLIAEGIVEAVKGFGADDATVTETRRLLAGQAEVVRQAAERGITVLAGTDAGMVPHGLVGAEIGALMRAGLTPGQALGAGSWLAREYLGLPGIEQDAPADLVGYSDDPRQDPQQLRRPAVVVLDGQLINRSTTTDTATSG